MMVFLRTLLLIVLLTYTLFPFYWTLNASLQPPENLFATPPDYFPIPASTASYSAALADTGFLVALRNSIIVSGSTTLVALLTGSLAAYALGRYRVKGGRFVLAFILAMTLFPQISILGAVHSIISWLGLYNRLAGLVLSYMLITLPLTVWILTSFFRDLPRELEESAYVDGASPFQTYYKVLLPLAMPGIAATGLLVFIAAWNEYLFAQSFTISADARTVSVAIANFTGATIHETPWGAIMAACVIVTLPLVAVVLLFQRRIVEGLTSGAVKG